jgi:hypothetical protein
VLRALLHFRGEMSDGLRQHIDTGLARLKAQFLAPPESGSAAMPQPWRQLGEAASAKDDELTYLLRLLRDTARDSSQQVGAT